MLFSPRRIAGAITTLAIGFACNSRGDDAADAPSKADASNGSNTEDGSASETSDAATLPPIGDGLGAATFVSGDLDAPSNGGTITFQNIGAPGWYPRVEDPTTGKCDVSKNGTCCLGKHEISSDALTPWDEDLILTLRGPLLVKQFAVYQPSDPAGGPSWSLVSGWDDRKKASLESISFEGTATKDSAAKEQTFAGTVGSECLVNVASSQLFPCGTGSNPFCPTPAAGKEWHRGFRGSKIFVLLAKMGHAAEVSGQCSKDNTGNWYDAPWLGLSVGELVRAGSFSSCQCYAKDPAKWYLGDGCGQFNAFEVVNDNNASKNLGVFSTNFFGYAGYVGEGPCGAKCNTATLNADVDLVDKSKDLEAAQGAVSNPTKGPGAAFRRPEKGYRYFLVAFDVSTRTVQLGIVHPSRIPPSLAPILPALPKSIDRASVDALLATRLPR